MHQLSKVEILKRLVDKDYEPLSNEYAVNLKIITNILLKYETVEGNIFGHHGTDPTTYPRAEFKNKRRNLTLFALTKNNVLEIGFNAGHSALLMLTANPNLVYTAIDLGCNPYVDECYAFLKSVFGGRINLIKGNSLTALPELLEQNTSFDGYIVDGDHTVEVTYSDLLNITKYAKDGSMLCFDDSEVPELRILVNCFMMEGTLLPIADNNGFITDDAHMFFRITK
jgi:hypothetical protein